MAPRARAVPHPVLSSPGRLALAGFGFTLVVYAVQIESGVPAWTAWSPVELSSNVVALAGLAWAALQLAGARAEESARRAWLAAAAGMALLGVEGDVGPLFGLESHGAHEMSLSVALWLAGAALIFRAGARFAMRRSVREVLRLGLAVQLGAQLIGLWTAYDGFPDHATELLDYVNDTGELAAVLAYLIALLLAVFAPVRSYALPPSAVGRKGRAIFRDFGLRRAGPHPTRQAHAVRALGTAVAIARVWRTAARPVARAGGPGRVRQLLDLVVCAGRGVGPDSYYRLELHRAAALEAAADAAATAAEAGRGLLAALRRTRHRVEPPCDLDDRLAFARVCGERRLPVRPALAAAEEGALRALPGDGGGFDRDLVVMRRRGAAGAEIALTREAPLLYRDGEGELINLDIAAARLAAASRNASLVVVPRLEPHESVARYARSGTVTFRVLTCLDGRDEPRATHALMRVAGSGRGWAAPIDVEAGAYGRVLADAAASGDPRGFADPGTGEMVAGRACAGWPALMRAALDAHRVFDAFPLVVWDLAWTPDGPLLLAGDPEPELETFQRVCGALIGASPLAPLLDAHLDRAVAERI